MAWRVFVATLAFIISGFVLGPGSLAPEFGAQAAPSQAPAVQGELLVKFKDRTTPPKKKAAHAQANGQKSARS